MPDSPLPVSFRDRARCVSSPPVGRNAYSGWHWPERSWFSEESRGELVEESTMVLASQRIPGILKEFLRQKRCLRTW